MQKTRNQGLQSAATLVSLYGELPGWLRWFANMGLSLSAAGYAIAATPRPPAAARRRHV